MITNKKTMLKKIRRDFPEWIFAEDKILLNEIEEKLCINKQIELKTIREKNGFANFYIQLYDFELLKNGKYRFLG